MPTSVADLRSLSTEDFLTNKAANGMLLVNALKNIAKQPSAYTLDGHVFTEDSVDLLKPGALDGYDIMIGGSVERIFLACWGVAQDHDAGRI